MDSSDWQFWAEVNVFIYGITRLLFFFNVNSGNRHKIRNGTHGLNFRNSQEFALPSTVRLSGCCSLAHLEYVSKANDYF